MVLTSPKKASKYFKAKMEFTTGPIELNGMIQQQEDINIIDVRKPEDFRQGHIPGAINLQWTHCTYPSGSKAWQLLPLW